MMILPVSATPRKTQGYEMKMARRLAVMLASVAMMLSEVQSMAGGGVLAASYNASTDVPVTASSYTATGSTVNFTLHFAPPTGTTFTVINNTGLDFIHGTFSNLAQGQVVNLSYGGVTYQFVANYYGGTGNDLVLQWASIRPVAWGQGTSGQLGNSSAINTSLAEAVDTSGVLAGKTVTALATGQLHSVALCSDGTLAAWGDNGSGQLGDGTTAARTVPASVDMSGVLAGKTVIAVTAGVHHSVALCSDGTVAGWGDNRYGQLGNQSTTNSQVPVLVYGSGALSGKTVVAVAAGSNHNLALCSDGTLAAWGYNEYGELGDTSATYSSPYGEIAPIAVYMGTFQGKSVIAVAAGGDHNLALCADGSLATWGYNGAGQLGNNTVGYSSGLVAVDTSGVLAHKTVVAVAAGYAHCLALCSDGTVAAWGKNAFGGLGNNSTTDSPVPVAMNRSGALAGKKVIAVAAGTYHSLVRCSDGTLAACGYNLQGELGNNSTTSSLVPVALDTSTLPAGARFVLGTTGQSADHSQGLIALPQSQAAAPQMVVEQPAGTNLISGATIDFGGIAAGSKASRTFTLKNSGSATLKISSLAIDGVDSKDFTLTTRPATSVAAGSITSFTLTFSPGAAFSTRTGALHIAGNDPGIGLFNVRLTGVGTSVLTAAWSTGLEAPLTAGSFTAAGSTVNLTLNYAPAVGTTLRVVNNTGLGLITGVFSNLAQGQLVSLAYQGVSYRFVANYYGGTGNDLVLQWAGTMLVAWGVNSNGQLGIDSTTTDSPAPVAVTTTGVLAGKTLVAVAAGAQHSLALCSDGTLAAWGDNEQGQLGDNSGISSSVPVLVDRSGVLAGKTVIAATAGGGFSLALCSDGTIAAWGTNGFGQLGDGTITDSPVPVAVDTFSALAGKTVIAVAAGAGHSLALCADGTVAAWGGNPYGQLGDNTIEDSSVPVAVNTAGILAHKTVIAIAAGQAHSVALCADGTLAAWGDNELGQLGDNSRISKSAPVAVNTSGVLAHKTVTAMAAGFEQTLALCADGTLAAWGGNDDGELGNNGSTDSALGPTGSPVPVAIKTMGVLAGKKVVAVAAGAFDSLALCADGTLAAWGSNEYGGVGEGTGANVDPFLETLPVAVKPGSQVVGSAYVMGTMGSSAMHSFALVAMPVPLITAPQMVAEQPAGIPLPNDASRDFGGAAPGKTVTRVFTLKNTGKAVLNILGFLLDGADSGDFSVTTPPAASVPPGGSTTLTVTFQPGGVDRRSATLKLASNDPTQNPFVIALAGTGVATPAIDTLPVAILNRTGEATTFTVDASGGALSYQWSKNDVVVSGATDSSYSIPAVTTADAGRYAVRVANAAGSATRLIANLGVVDVAPATVTLVNGSTITLKASAAGPDLTYQWEKNGVPLTDGTNPAKNSLGMISGVTTSKLVITKALHADSDSYTCLVAMPDPRHPGTVVSLASGVFTVNVTIKPVFNTFAPGPWMVSGTVTDVITALNNPTAFSLTGQPAGVTLDASGRFHGKPTVAISTATSYHLMITASNGAGRSAPLGVDVTVLPLRGNVMGAFNGLVDRDAVLSGGHGGTLTVVSLSTGTFSGRLTLGALAYGFVGSHLDTAQGTIPAATVVITRAAPLHNLTLAFTIDEDTGELLGTVSDGVAGAVNVQAWRNPWHAVSNPAPMNGYYTCELALPPALSGTVTSPANVSYPQGTGFGSLAITTAGVAIWSGRLADGAVTTAGTTMGTGGDVPLHFMLYGNTGSAHGRVTATADSITPPANNGLQLINGGIDWMKSPQAAESNDRIYKGGIALHTLAVIGGQYSGLPPSINDQGPGTTDARLNFSEGGLLGPPPVVVAVMAATLDTSFRIAAGSRVFMPAGARTNPAALTLTLNAATGVFNGTFVLKNDPDPTDHIPPIALLSRTVSYYGLLVPRLSVNKGAGFFLLPELPEDGPPKTTLNTSPTLSGKVLLEAAP